MIIDYLRNRPAAVEFLENLTQKPTISVATLAELYAGVREGKEEKLLDQLRITWDIVPITADISRNGGIFRRDFGGSHGVGLIDGLIAASALARNATLVTLNTKHFPMLNVVTRPY